MIIADVMSRGLVTIDPGVKVRDAERIAESHDVKHLLVVRGGELLGVVCRCDLANAPEDGVVERWMSKHPVLAEWHDRVRDAASKMTKEKIGCLPVVAEGRLVGIVTRSDLAREGVQVPKPVLACASCRTTEDVHVRHGDTEAWCLSCMERSHSGFEYDVGGGD